MTPARTDPEDDRRAPAARERVPGGRAAALLLLGLVAACSEVEGHAPQFRPIQRPALTAVGTPPPVANPSPWWTTEPAEGGVEVVAALRTAVEADPGLADSRGRLRLFHREAKVIALTPPSTGRLDRIRIRVAIDRHDTLVVRWLRAGTELGATTIPLFPTVSSSVHDIDFAVDHDRACDRIEVSVPGFGPVAIGRIELFELASTDRLARPGEPPSTVRFGDDVRPAFGLAPDRPLQVAFEAPPDGILVASAAVPLHLRFPDDEPTLAVVVRDPDGAERRHRFPLYDYAAPTTWTAIRIPVTRTGGGTTSVRFEFESIHPRDAACALTQPQVVSFDENAPTVLLVTSDTHRGDSTGFAHSGVPVRTPALDALAARGVVFTDAWSATNVTNPSHASILTGLPVRDTGMLSNVRSLAPEARTLAEAFTSAGWATVGAVSAGHLSADWSGFGQGFDRMADCTEEQRSAGETLARLERWVGDFRGRPLFIWLHLFDAHTPYAPPIPLDRRLWDPKRDPFDAALPAPDPRLVPDHLTGLRDLDFVVAKYRGEVDYLDGELTRLFDRPRFGEAIVAFTADHGESFGSHGVYWNHGGLYRDRLHVPLVLRWPGAPAGTRVSARVSNVDVGRTLLDLAGLANVDHPGTNLLTHVDEDAATAVPVFAIASFGFSASIAQGDDLLILHLADHTLHDIVPADLCARHTVELYDVRADPDCRHDLAGGQRENARELRRTLLAWLRAGETRSLLGTPAGSAQVLENLTALGYAQGLDRVEAEGVWFPTRCTCAACASFADG